VRLHGPSHAQNAVRSFVRPASPFYGLGGVDPDEGPELPLGVDPEVEPALGDVEPEAGGGGVEAGAGVVVVPVGAGDVMVLP
jgi:hypothetical protein